MRLGGRHCIAAGLLSIGMSSAAAETSNDGASRALKALLRAGEIVAPRSSGCAGALPGDARPTLGALLANRLSYLDGGVNRVRGQCGRLGRCEVAITHADGEDVESAIFRFEIARGRLRASSIQCVFTP